MKYITTLMLLLVQSVAFAARPIPLSGRVLNSDDTPITSSATIFDVKIQNATSCVIFEEQFTTDMTDSNGYFKFVLGTGTSVFTQNSIDLFRINTYKCADGTTWTSAQGDLRTITMSVQVNNNPWVVFSSDTINSQAYAQDAEYVRGLAPENLVQVNTITTQDKVDSLTLKTPALLDLANGISTLYAKTGDFNTSLNLKQNTLGFTPLSPTANLSDVASVAQARLNLGLGSLAVLSTIKNINVTDVAWSKITSAPTTFPPSAHTHPISDIVNLQSSLNGKVDKASFICTTNQTMSYISATDAFTCTNIPLAGDISGDATATMVAKIQGIPVDLTGIQDKMILQYNAASNKWIASAALNNTVPKVYAGEIFDWPGTTSCPVGTLSANGAAISPNLYPDLFAQIGYTYGNVLTPENGQNVNYFLLPDYRGMFRRTLDDGRNIDSGRVLSANYQVDMFKSHTHIQNAHSHLLSSPGALAGSGRDIGAEFTIDWNGSGGRSTQPVTATNQNTGGVETRPMNMAVKTCIRTANVY